MSQRRPGEDDFAFERGHADAGEKKRDARIRRLEGLLRRTSLYVPLDSKLASDINEALKKSFYDEEV